MAVAYGTKSSAIATKKKIFEQILVHPKKKYYFLSLNPSLKITLKVAHTKKIGDVATKMTYFEQTLIEPKKIIEKK